MPAELQWRGGCVGLLCRVSAFPVMLVQLFCHVSIVLAHVKKESSRSLESAGLGSTGHFTFSTRQKLYWQIVFIGICSFFSPSLLSSSSLSQWCFEAIIQIENKTLQTFVFHVLSLLNDSFLRRVIKSSLGNKDGWIFGLVLQRGLLAIFFSIFSLRLLSFLPPFFGLIPPHTLNYDPTDEESQ